MSFCKGAVAICTCFLIQALLVKSVILNGITISDEGGYENILLALSDELSENDCSSIIDSIKIMMERASVALFNATNEKLHFRHVSVLLPSRWNSSKCGISALIEPSSSVKFGDADIVVKGPHPVYGSVPWTQQPRGCGEVGDFIQFSSHYLINLNQSWNILGDPGKVFLREWAKYRYGVYDEIGYPDDPLYPSLHRTDDDKGLVNIPTSCTNVPVTGSFQMSSADQTGMPFVPDNCPACNANVHSSIMYLASLPNVTYFCNSSNHGLSAPTKHNSLCSWKSTWDVISQHPDLKRNSTKVEPAFWKPMFTYFKKMDKRIVFLLDKSSSMEKHDRFLFVKRAMFEFFKTAPTGTQVGIIMYAEKTESVLPLTVITDSNRDTFFDELDQTVSEANLRNTMEAVQKGLQLFLGNTEEGDIVIVTCEREKPTTVKLISELITQSKSRLSLINYNVVQTPELLDLVKITRGQVSYVEEKLAGNQGQMRTLLDLSECLARLFDGSTPDSALIYEKEFTLLAPKQRPHYSVEGQFSLDSSIATVYFTVFYYYGPQGYYEPGRISVTSPTGVVHTNLESSYTGTKVIRIANPQTGVWKYSLISTTPNPQSMVVRISGRFGLSTEPIQIRSWTNYENQVRPSEKPLVLFVSVKQGDSVILDADVIAEVQFTPLQGAGGTLEKHIIKLGDNGWGDPDIQQGDGIYCNYFTKLSRFPGRYSVTTSVTGLSGKTAVVVNSHRLEEENMPGLLSVPLCCGSQLPKSVVTSPMSNFERVLSGPEWFSENGYPLFDYYPPGRVPDLTSYIPEDEAVTAFQLQWTAPGGDFQFGIASSYEVRYARQIEALIRTFNRTKLLKTIPSPQPAGTRQVMDVNIADNSLDHNSVYYFALRASDVTNSGKLSNIVRIYIPPLPTTTTTTTTTPLPPSVPSTSWGIVTTETTLHRVLELSILQIAGIVAGGIVFIFILISLCVYYCAAVRRKQKSMEHPPPQEEKAPVTNGFIRKQPDGSESKAVGMHKDKQKQNLINGDIYTICNGRSGPGQSWTASQLLKAHETQQVMTPNGTIHDRRSLDEDPYGNRPHNGSYHSTWNQYTQNYPKDKPSGKPYSVNELNYSPSVSTASGYCDNPLRSPNKIFHPSGRGNVNPDLEISYDSDRQPFLSSESRAGKHTPPPLMPRSTPKKLHPTPNGVRDHDTSGTEKKVRNITQV